MKTTLASFNKEKLFVVSFDTCVTINDKNRISKDKLDEYESFRFRKLIKKSGATYKVVNPNGPADWPVIEYTGTLNQLLPILVNMDSNGRTRNEWAGLLLYFDGDASELEDLCN